ncbi:MAG TPA: ParB/RepB/Spo0J family partition protein [Myxococcota bacterium]|nr:ParB/RepB/Spo0J family partition protein [Myxococcota bacterium]HRY92914.1 ParB/RepB/Spo0J family partition protein [Myxococcota bacterium]HSA19867.1 ParB/RepB/Spo0J family partition protein [Myxococcota bacterium]
MESKRKALGKGLAALIPVERKPAPAGAPQGAAGTGGLFECPVDRLEPNAEQPRQSFDEGRLRELADSVKTQGVLQPLVVRALGDGRFQIVAGERRWRAARLAGLERVPVVVKNLSDSESLEVALIENIQREDLNPLEEAEAYRLLIEEHGLTQERLATRVGRQRSTVTNALRLLKLPEELKTYLLTGELTMGHARAILGIEGESHQMAIARKVVREKLSVRACEELIRNAPAPKAKHGGGRKAKARPYSPAQFQLVETLQRRLSTKVDLHPGRKGGRVVIHYYSLDDLDRLLAVIEGK